MKPTGVLFLGMIICMVLITNNQIATAESDPCNGSNPPPHCGNRRAKLQMDPINEYKRGCSTSDKCRRQN
ncbi:unnamed protein product [Amaranthus hypochondriacus]